MAISLLTNLPAINIRHHLNDGEKELSTAMERLASGRRINRVGDDAAGLAISESIEARIRSIRQAGRNAQDAISLLQVAGSGMHEIGNILIRLRELSTQAGSDNVGESEREMLNIEAQQLISEIDRIAHSTKYLDTYLLNGTGRDFIFQIGPDADENSQLSYDASQIDVRASALGVDGVDLTERDSAIDGLQALDASVSQLHAPQALLGALQSRMSVAIKHLETYDENLTAASSRIRDADFAKETTALVRGQVRQRAAIAVLSQANMLPMHVLKLIEG